MKKPRELIHLYNLKTGDSIVVGVSVPRRRRKAICLQQGATITPLAYFTNEEAVATFEQFLEQALQV